MINYILIFIIILSLTGIVALYRTGMTGNVVKEINGSFINLTKEIKISDNLTKEFDGIAVKSIEQQGDVLNITYVFDNSYFIGNEADIEIWIENQSQAEVKRNSDYFSIDREGLIERNVLINFGGLPNGSYNIYFSFGDGNKAAKESIILESSITGKTILDEPRNKWAGYIIFILVIIAGVFFIIRSHGVENTEKP